MASQGGKRGIRILLNLTLIDIDVARLLHREESYEYLAPLYSGETLTGVMTVLDGSTRKGKNNSSVDLVTLQLCYKNHEGQTALVATTRLVSRE